MGPDGAPRLVSVDYDAPGRGAAYDPVLFWWAPWRDHFHYDVMGRLTGWTRQAMRPRSPLRRQQGTMLWTAVGRAGW